MLVFGGQHAEDGPILEGVGDDPHGPDVNGVLHAGLEGNNLVLSEGYVLREHWVSM